MQAKLLRLPESGSFRRVGETLRPIFAWSPTPRDLKAMAGRGGFRRDLYYRLSVFPVHLAGVA